MFALANDCFTRARVTLADLALLEGRDLERDIGPSRLNPRGSTRQAF